MLAVAAEPFDSEDHLYEVKWDGVRCVAAAEHGAVRLSSCWRKIKPRQIFPCVIIGYVPSKGGFRSLLVAAQHEGMLSYVGEVSRGLTRQEWARLASLLPGRVRHEPIVPCRKLAESGLGPGGRGA